jgi:hypothetical protein
MARGAPGPVLWRRDGHTILRTIASALLDYG